MFNCVIAGVGGQGTVLASKLIAAAAMAKGLDVRTTETIGMAQRGSSVISHIRAADSIAYIHSPIIPLGTAHAIIAFEPSEAVRQLPFLAAEGRMVACATAVQPIGGKAYDPAVMTDFLEQNAPRLILVDGAEIMRQCPKALNVALLGAAAQAGVFPFDADTLKGVLADIVPPRFLELNHEALRLGRSLVI